MTDRAPIRLSATYSTFHPEGLSPDELRRVLAELSDPEQYVQDDPLLQYRKKLVEWLLFGIPAEDVPMPEPLPLPDTRRRRR